MAPVLYSTARAGQVVEVKVSEPDKAPPAKAGTVSTEISISALDPDADGDGNVSPLEMEIYKALKASDIDGSGSIGVGELYKVIGDLVGEKAKVKRLSKLVGALIALVVLALGSIFVVSLLAGEAIKESHVNKGGLMTSTNGAAVKVTEAENTYSLFSLPKLPIEGVATIKRINLYVNTTGNAELGNGIIASTFQVSSAMKFTENSVAFFTPSGAMIMLDTAKNGTITMNGATYPVDDEDRSDENAAMTTPSRRVLRRGRTPSLQTTGFFTMSTNQGAAGGAGR